jgi:hypothetical protein
MSATYSYARVLHTVGQVLDQIGVKSIAIREEDDGLFVEGYDSEGQFQLQLRYDIASLYDLLHKPENMSSEEQSVTGDGGALRRFLAAHSQEALIGALR